jgi:hypothetical protein
MKQSRLNYNKDNDCEYRPPRPEMVNSADDTLYALVSTYYSLLFTMHSILDLEIKNKIQIFSSHTKLLIHN